jgi:undecaprenyl-phosphate galactose phosphotransferase
MIAGLLANTLHWLRPSLDAADYVSLWTGQLAQHRGALLLPLFVIAIAWFWSLGHYTRRRPFWDELFQILRTLLLLGLLDAALQYIVKLPFSRFWYLGAWTSALVLLPMLRTITKKLLRRLDVWQRPVIVLGTGPNAVDAVEALYSEQLMGYEVEVFADHTQRSSSELGSIHAAGRDIPVVPFDPDPQQLRALGESTVIVALEQGQLNAIAPLIGRLHRACGDLQIVPALRGIPLFGTEVHYFFRHELLFLRLGNNLSRRGPRLIKRGFDVAVAAVLLLLCSPVFATMAVLIRKDRGPVFFAHQRVGERRKAFDCFKFRTMVPNAQAVLDHLLQMDPAAREEWQRDFKLKKDPRITPIGRFLRRYSLDELPQLWNVIRGEMSLVGPRPIVEGELVRYGDDVEYYLKTKPGMTGLWQISGRNDTGYADRVYLDAWYVKNWSLSMDVVILFKTINVVLRNDGAY